MRMMAGTVDRLLTGEGADTVFGGSYRVPMVLLSIGGAILPPAFRTRVLDISDRCTGDSFLMRVA